MKIALYGYGKMGHAIESEALKRGHSVPLKVDRTNAGAAPKGIDVAIDFSRPDTVLGNVEQCLAQGVPVVVGTTGWYDHLDQVAAMVKKHDGALLWASNFSIGVQLFFKLNKLLARMMANYPGYQAAMEEVHHVHKLDAPSGTAISLANGIMVRHPGYTGWQPGPDGANGKVPIASIRTGEVPGTHTVSWTSAQDKLSITHEAFGRQGFALGAVVAAEWLQGRNGLFTMDDLLKDA